MSANRAASASAPAISSDDDLPSLTPQETAAAKAWQRVSASPIFCERLFGHIRPGILQRTPILLFGIAPAASAGGCWFLYCDAHGRRRALRPNDHDQAGIASLFEGAEGWLCRLWPAPGGGWDHERAAETLAHFQGCIGTVDAAALGFELPAEPGWL